jgi:hypothetical protein
MITWLLPSRSSAISRLAITALAVLVALLPVGAQLTRTGQNVVPVYEGWEPNPDGSFNLVFGYLNRNWEEELHLPLGPDNTIEPGGPDRGQPTHFFPRRNRFVFRIRVPKDFGSKELVWTLTSHGKTERAFGTLKPDYVLDETVIMSNIGAGGALSTTPDMVGNKAPVLKVEGPKTLSVKVGEPVTLVAIVTDDGKPSPRAMPPVLGGNYMLPNSAKGLRLSWFMYRGPGKVVSFDPPQAKVWEDTRDGGNSPWSAGWTNPPVPPEGKWVVRATFSEPGTYVLRCLAHDGGLASSEDVSVTVKPGTIQ